MGMKNEVSAALRQRNVGGVDRDMDRGDAAAVFQLRLLEELVVNRIAVGGETDVARPQTKGVVGGGPDLQPFEPIQELVSELRFLEDDWWFSGGHAWRPAGSFWSRILHGLQQLKWKIIATIRWVRSLHSQLAQLGESLKLLLYDGN